MDVAVQMLAFREGRNFTRTMDAWAEQPVPGFVGGVSYEAWVTPSARPKANCSTWRQAVEHPVFEANEAPKFKLPSLNAARQSAMLAGRDVFVTSDADAPPLARTTLTALLEPLVDSSVAAVASNPVCPTNPIGLYSNLGVTFKEVIGGLHGQCHALSAPAWDVAGPLDEDLDHTRLWSVWKEEEYRFAHRLRQYGQVRYRIDAPVYNDTRRRECAWLEALGKQTADYCERREGDETFNPDAAGRARGQGNLFHR